MKKILAIGSTLLVITSSAYASQARLNALGMNETDNDGMYYIQDSRNIFLNPAYINNYANQLTLEWGATGQNASVLGTTSASTINNNTYAPKAQGGFFKKSGDYVYGLYLGNESNTSSLIRIASSSAASTLNGCTAAGCGAGSNTNSKMLQSTDNQVDLFLGSETNGLKWAGNLLFANGKDESRSGKDTAIAIRGGVVATNWDAHLNLSLASKAEATDAISGAGAGLTAQDVKAEMKGKLGIQAGGSYVLPISGRVFGYVKYYGWEQTDSYTGYAALNAGASIGVGGQNGTVKGDFTSIYLGWGRDFDVNNGDKIFTSLSAKQTNINLKFSNKSEVRHLVVPVTFGYEAKATEWLTLRGSVVQNIYGQRDNKNITNYGSTGTRINKVASSLISKIYGSSGKATLENSTTVNAGATLAFGNFAVDGLIGITKANGDSTTSTTDVTPPKTGVLSLSNLETSVAMTYKF